MTTDPDEQQPGDDFFSAAGGSPREAGDDPPVQEPPAAPEPAEEPPIEVAPTSQKSVYADTEAAAPPPDRSYPYSPAEPATPQFGRRPPQRDRRPDADGYYPSDYYIGPDWMRIVVGGLAATVLLVGVVGLGFYLFDRFDPTTDDSAIADATPTPLPVVPVYECAGDPDPVTEMSPPADLLVAGRTADSRWLAFRNPRQPPLQLWVRAVSLPEFNTLTVGIVRCATSPDEFPTPANAPTPLPTLAPDATPAVSPTPEATVTESTPTPLVAPTTAPTATAEPTAVPTATEVPTATPEPTAVPTATEVPTATPEPTAVPTATEVPTVAPPPDTPTPTP